MRGYPDQATPPPQLGLNQVSQEQDTAYPLPTQAGTGQVRTYPIRVQDQDRTGHTLSPGNTWTGHTNMPLPLVNRQTRVKTLPSLVLRTRSVITFDVTRLHLTPCLLHVLCSQSCRHGEAIHPTARLHHFHLHPRVLHHRLASPQSPGRLSLGTRYFLLTDVTTLGADNLTFNGGRIHDRGAYGAVLFPTVAPLFGWLCLRVVGVDDLLSLCLSENLRSHLHEFVQPHGPAALTDNPRFSVACRHGRIGASRPVRVYNITN